MERKKLTKEDLDKVRHIEGFPIGKDEDIIALSDAPYYTACPNPFIEDFIRENGTPYDEETDDYHREPFAADVSEGKNDPIYNAHSYHTKVPHKAIMRFVLHYTKPGDIIYDGFCGTGMAGVAAQMCECPDAELKRQIEFEMPNVQWGTRKVVLNDLSPAATFIAQGYNFPVDVIKLQAEANRILQVCEDECGWMYETYHVDKNGNAIISLDKKPVIGRIQYVVWSDVFICPNCSKEIVFWEAAVNQSTGTISDDFLCPHCASKLKKRDCDRAWDYYYDRYLKENTKIAKQVPVHINYTVGNERYTKIPDDYDLQIIQKIKTQNNPYFVPCFKNPSGEKMRDPERLGICYSHQFYTDRNLYVLSSLWDKSRKSDLHAALTYVMTGIVQISSKLSRFRYDSRNPKNTAGGIMNGTLFIPSLSREGSVFENYTRRLSSILQMFSLTKSFKRGNCLISCGAQQAAGLPENSIDYIFTDPPFGANINYSELSNLWEAWLRVQTRSASEAIISTHQGKALPEYQGIMEACFKQYYHALKPNHWITIEFHNSKNAVWNAIQEGLLRAGFVVADVRVIDKKQGSFNQVSSHGAVQQDLIISAYKPNTKFYEYFLTNSGTEETVWSFIRQHLSNIPVVVLKKGKIEVISERQGVLLFDRMVAYHLMQGIPVPLDATEFYRGLDEHYLKRDGMYFLPEQVNEYDQARIENDVEDVQLSLIVSNEKSAIEWLYRQLETPQTYAELQPKFMQEVRSIDKYEDLPELSVLLEENFLQDDKGRWYIPDVTKEADMAKLREKSLIKEFEGYLAAKGKLKLFRSEAIRAGFAKLWKEKNYKLIVETAERLPEKIIQEDDKLLMYYDLSLGRV